MVRLAMVREEFFQGGQNRRFSHPHRITNLLTQRICVRRIQPGIIPGSVNRRHNREQRRAEIELAAFGRTTSVDQRVNEQGWEKESDQTVLPWIVSVYRISGGESLVAAG